MTAMPRPRLALFDLDHTLLDGDSDLLWGKYLVGRGELAADAFNARNRELQLAYRAGTVGPAEFTGFYVATLAGRSPDDWEPVRQDFLRTVIAARLPPASHRLVAEHRDAGELVVLTTATNRFLAELTAAHLGIEHLIATDCALDAQGRFNGATVGTLNMREGKLARLHAWLAGRGARLADFDSTFYSDSINDLPLLLAVDRAVAVGPDEQLAQQAARLGWPVLRLHPPKAGR
jgi:HAD superfamily hydrolase (TIGR01490 family)